MKTKSTILAAFMTALTLVFASANAQTEPAVKILPSSQEGIFKVLYAYETDQPVQVNFLNEEGLISSDRIRETKFQHGFFKKYDVSNINARVFWIEVKAANIAVTYKMTKSKSGAFVPTLEQTTYNHDVVARNN